MKTIPQYLEVFRSGVWASLCGGWFYNPSLSRQVNLIHLYLFLSLTVGPAVVHLTSGSLLAWSAYLVCVHIFFVVLKAVNWRLHALFDTSEAIEEAVDSDIDEDNADDANNELDSIKVLNDANPQQRLAEIRRTHHTSNNRRNDFQNDVEIEMKVNTITELSGGRVNRDPKATSSSRGSSPIDSNHHTTWPQLNTGPSTDDGSGRLEPFHGNDQDGERAENDPDDRGRLHGAAPKAKFHLKVDVHSKPVGSEEDYLRSELTTEQRNHSLLPNKGDIRKSLSANVSRDALMEPLDSNEEHLCRRVRQYRSLIDVGGHYSRVTRNSESNSSRSIEAIDNACCTCNRNSSLSTGKQRTDVLVKRSKSTFETSNSGQSGRAPKKQQERQVENDDDGASVPLLNEPLKHETEGGEDTFGTSNVSVSCKPTVSLENQLISVPPCEWMHTDSEPESPSTPKQLETSSKGDTEISKGAIPKRPRGESEALRNIMESLLNTDNNTSNSDDEQQQSLLLKQRLLEVLSNQDSRLYANQIANDESLHCDSHIPHDDAKPKVDIGGKAADDNRSSSTEELRSQQRRLRRARRRAERERRRAERERRRALAETSTGRELINHPMPSNGKPSDMLNVPEGAHVATSYEDTSEGAIHCFVDEFGNWHSYTFGPSNNGTDSGVKTLESSNHGTFHEASVSGWDGEGLVEGAKRQASCESQRRISEDVVAQSDAEIGAVTSVGPLRHRRIRNSSPQRDPLNVDAPNSSISAEMSRRLHQETQRPLPSHQIIAMYRRWESEDNPQRGAADLIVDKGEIYGDHSSSSPVRVRKYYLLPLFSTFSLRVPFDRLTLLSTLDKNATVIDSLLSVFLGTITALLTALVLLQEHYKDLQVLLFCLISGSCQYCLLKSVQPDSSSPSHGYNRIIVYSRAVYFSLCSIVTLLLEYLIGNQEDRSGSTVLLTMDKVVLTNDHAKVLLNCIYTYILCFPLLFMLGLMPQVDTFVLYLSEQVEIHVFGGHAAPSLASSLFCLVRSASTCLLLLAFAYGGMTGETHSVHTQEILFSLFCALSAATSYHLSRANSDPSQLFEIVRKHVVVIDQMDNSGIDSKKANDMNQKNQDDKGVDSHKISAPRGDMLCSDPLPQKLQDTIQIRLMNDMLVCFVMATVVFLVHSTGLLINLEPNLSYSTWTLAIIVGFIAHYLMPQLRKELPWTLISHPILKSAEHNHFEARQAAKVMWFEKILVWLIVLEKNVLYPTIFLAAITRDREAFKYYEQIIWAAMILVVCTVKSLRASFSDGSKQYLVLLATILCVKVGRAQNQPFIVVYFVLHIAVHKLHELYLKMQFVFTYVAPWQITWGSGFHAFAQPFSVPHSAILLLQAFIAALISAPLNPILGSAIFLVSYVRPVKFWERDYNTRRVDHSNTRLSSQLESLPGGDDNNFNSIFYEHLTRSLQHSLCGDLMMGRWGSATQGDCFVLASDYLNCLVHIVEVGNGLVSFQVRGLEFRGTYCQQREVEAISEGVDEDLGLCCCEPGHLPHLLSLNAAFGQRWLAWEVSAVKYILEAYSISDNSAQSILQVYDLRKVLINYYVKSIIFYLLRSPRLDSWLSNSSLMSALSNLRDRKFADLDPVFSDKIDEDFDLRVSGITRGSFCNVYLQWIAHCARKRDSEKFANVNKDSDVVTLALALSLLGRRALYAASQFLSSVEFFLLGLHALFKGDFRITSVRDEWIFIDMELMRQVVSPGVKMSVKLHQDHFMAPDEYDDVNVLYDAIDSHEKCLVIAHESDPAWREAVLSGASSLLALRHVLYDSNDEFKIIMLNKRHISFRVIKLNKECVRGLWAGQQQELIFLRNRNPERGSIQNAKQALRNIINSSCDQPIGYPIYVSPLTTSYLDTHEDLNGIIGGPITISKLKQLLQRLWRHVYKRILQSCATQSSSNQNNNTVELEQQTQQRDCHLDQHRSEEGRRRSTMTQGATTVSLLQHRPSLSGSLASGGKTGSLSASIAANILNTNNVDGSRSSGGSEQSCKLYNYSPKRKRSREDQRRRQQSNETTTTINNSEPENKRIARIVDSYQVYDNINLGRRIDPLWPNEEWRLKGGRSNWKDWVPTDGMQGEVLHTWTPCNRDPQRRSHVDKTIVLIRIGERCVPIVEGGVSFVDDDHNKGNVGKDNSRNDNGDKQEADGNALMKEEDNVAISSSNEASE